MTADPSQELAERGVRASGDGAPSRAWTVPASSTVRYGGAILVVAACTVAAALMEKHFDLSNLTMVYLFGVVVTAVGFGRGPAILASCLGVAAFDYGFVPPRFNLRVSDTQYLVVLAAMLTVAVVTGTLTARLREQLEEVRRRERRTAALFRLSHELVSRSVPDEVLAVAVARIGEVLGARVALVRPDVAGQAVVLAGDPELVQAPEEHSAARRAFENGEIAGLDHVARNGALLHVPLAAGLQTYGVVAAQSLAGGWSPERLQLLRMLASQTALALERCRLAEESHVAKSQAETERARSALLSSVSHDLRTPLAAITGAATSLRDGASRLDDATRSELADMIAEEAQRLNRLIGNILDMTRLESGTLAVRKEWHSIEEVVGAALVRLELVLGRRPVHLLLPADLPLVSLDDVLFEQVVWNLVENAHKYSPDDSPIEVRASIDGSFLKLEVADRGPGLLPGDELRIFDKFYRGANAGRQGAGLGLAICHSIVAAHGGTITAANRPEGGAAFTVRIPLTGTAPTVERESGEPVVASPS